MKESMEEWLYFNNVKYTVEKNTKPSAKVAQELYSLSSASNLSSNDTSSNQTPSQSVGDGNVSAPANPEVPVSPAAPVTPPEAPASSAAAPVTPEVPVSPVAPVTPEAPVAPASSAAAPVTPEVPVSPVASVAPVTPTDAPVSPASVAPVSAPIAPAGNVGAYLREHQGNNNNSGVIDPSGASWRNNYGQVAPGFFNKPNTAAAGDTTTTQGSNQTVPPNNGFSRYNQGIIDPAGASWRGNYGQVAPGFFHKSGVASAGDPSSSPGSPNPVVPQGDEGGQAAAPYNPNQNGNSSNGPAWKPRISSPGWSAPQPHTADSGPNPAQQKQFSVANALLNASLVPRTSYVGNLFGGGVGGVLGAGPLPWTLNKVVDFTVKHTKEGGKVNDAASYVQEKLNPKVFTKAKFTTVTSKIAELDKTINDIKAGTNNEILNLKHSKF